ncbi:hypothetical protein GALL_71380 [mine drainage metagenome]|uniref:Uncharacterized protein n=1 Tax=mine drainage metagenome TaxID=410659 RepID=A0A1J5SR90_9ZZZZ
MGLWTNAAKTEVHDDKGGVALTYPSWPQGLTQITQAEADAIRASVSAIPLPQQAQSALDKVTGPSGTIMRCVAAGVAVPAAWTTYVQALRAIASGTDKTSTALPPQPAYPAGT